MKWFVVTIFMLSLSLECEKDGVVKIPTNSMEPTIKMGAVVQIDEAYYTSNPIRRFDIVVVKDPDGKDSKYIKRIIGLGGENFQIKDGKILVNGEQLKEPFVSIPPDEDFEKIDIPKGEYLLLGDNRANSYDSRYWKKKTVSNDAIFARVLGYEPKNSL
jgi:signal peptidase I